MQSLRQILVIFFLAWVANIASCQVQGTYNAEVSNLCEGSDAGPDGPCYQLLPKGGFPITYAWDTPNISVQGNLSLVEDRFEMKFIILNFGVYFILFWGIGFLTRKRKS